MKKIVLVFISISVFALVGFTGNYLYKLNKSFDIFAEIIEHVSNDYVLDIDPETLVKHGINGMLSSLDPYTNYYDKKDQSQLELFTDGTYTGIGITVSTIDSLLTISDIKFEGPAYNSGFRIGDVIFSIDSINVYNLHPSEIRDYITYETGKEFEYRIIRNSDTLSLNVVQQKIEVDDVPYSEVSKDNILYVKVDYFSRKTANDFKEIINEIHNKENLNGVIVDLRDNPGGLLYSSVELSELFLPMNSLVVSTKGKNVEESFETNKEPVLDSLPLVVIINENSASASEILAGAVQDHDRGVIIGRKSFGKGLVQTIINLPYESNLKITTAKYYTPSGRSIQKLKFADEYSGKVIEDTIKKEYYTDNKRKVIEESGIVPDTIINYISPSDFVKFLNKENIIFNFATDFCSKMHEPTERMSDTNMVFDEFVRYMKRNNIEYVTDFNKSLDSIENYMRKEGIETSTINKIKDVRVRLSNTDKLLSDNKSDIISDIKIEIIRRYFDTNNKFRYYLKNDNFYKAAKNIILSNKYRKFLN